MGESLLILVIVGITISIINTLKSQITLNIAEVLQEEGIKTIAKLVDLKKHILEGKEIYIGLYEFEDSEGGKFKLEKLNYEFAGGSTEEEIFNGKDTTVLYYEKMPGFNIFESEIKETMIKVTNDKNKWFISTIMFLVLYGIIII